MIARGHVDEGFSEMQAAAENARRLGLHTGTVGFHYHHALACFQVGRLEEAEVSVGAGLAFSRGSGARILLVPLLGLRAQLEWATGQCTEASATWGHAIGAARAQGSAFQELQVLAAARAHGDTTADPLRLQQVLDLYAGDPSPIVRFARSIADGLASDIPP